MHGLRRWSLCCGKLLGIQVLTKLSSLSLAALGVPLQHKAVTCGALLRGLKYRVGPLSYK